ncbi:MAG: von Willebrand factor type A domain-containing protein [Rhizobiaceae bacterium]|nr:von Willebrand factor type A domain-containing protein [Rhizobiaceae bacterium]
MAEHDEFDILRTTKVPAPRRAAKEAALRASVAAFDSENSGAETKGSIQGKRLTERARQLWRDMMQKKMLATPALATLIALPIAGYAAFQLVEGNPFGFKPVLGEGPAGPLTNQQLELPKKKQESGPSQYESESDAAARSSQSVQPDSAPPVETADERARGADDLFAPGPATQNVAPSAPPAGVASKALGRNAVKPTMSEIMPAPADSFVQMEENRDRLEEFKTNPVRSALEDPVSTFSIDVDTASYSFVRASLKRGLLPQADTVRVEEMINYFPYDWKGPDSAKTPFNTTVAVMPTPWNANTKLMHVAIKGYDVQPAEQPKANLVFLLDVSGSMNQPDKLPLLQSAFRLLVNKLRPDDTVSIVTYAGNAGTVLEPTKASEKNKILDAIDSLIPGGSTAGEAGIKEAYRLAEKSFVKDGVNRVMLATDGDFNVGQSDDDDLKRIIEEKRESGVFLSVFGFGRGNLNDQMMQTIAQNGNGTAAYIDTLQEAEKVLVQDASSTLFPIAKDVKIQVEFNPAKVSEYRLIGYETRVLNREDFNNDRVDAGEIGSGHSVTAIYEITPKGAPQMIDDLRYGEASTDSRAGIANADEYAFVKIRYKAPDADVSKLITSPVTSANEISSFDQASSDQRFSVAVAAFGQKLRHSDQTAAMGWDQISQIASASRGSDPFGYRAEFLSLVRLASALDKSQR